MKTSETLTRTYRPEDKQAITEICYQTGYMGESVAGRFKDRDLFGELFAYAYLSYRPEMCFVAEVDARVVGYCIAAADTKDFKQWFNKHHKKQIIKRIIQKTLWCHPYDVFQLISWDFKSKRHPPQLFVDYPAHFHINVLARHQRSGIGSELIQTVIQNLKQQQVSGIHLQTSSRNTSALKFYEKQGFLRVYERDQAMWGVPGVRSIVMGMKL